MNSLIITVFVILGQIAAYKFVKLYYGAIDEMLVNINKAMRGDYKSKYKKRKGRK